MLNGVKTQRGFLFASGLAWAMSAFMPSYAFAQPDPDPNAAPKKEAPPLAPFTPTDKGFSPPAPIPDLEPSIEESFRLLQAKQTVSTASKREQAIADVPLTISAIPAEELEGTGQFTLCDAIQYFPGIECRRGAMRKAAVSVRGLGSNFLSNRMLLLIDGRPATDPWTGQFYADETTPLTNLKQIEVIRGPGSSLYGSNAFGGVINMVTRGPDDMFQQGRKWGMDARVLAGMYNTYRGQATAAVKLGLFKALVNYYGYYTDGPQLLNDARTGVVDKQEWAQVHQVTGKVEIKSVGVDVGYTWSDEGRPGGQSINQVGNCGRCHYTSKDREKVEQFFINGHVDQRVTSWLRLYGQVYANFKRREVTLFNDIVGDEEITLGKRRRVGVEARALFNYKQWLNVTVGGDLKFDTVNNRNILPTLQPSDVAENIYGVFVDAEARPVSKLIIGAGVRYDYYDIPAKIWARSSSQVSPRGSIVFHAIPQLTLRANYGRAFRAPSLVELAINQQMYASTLLGNPNLRAETVDTVEFAIDAWPWKDFLRLSATGFYNKANNLINQQHLQGSTSIFQNIGDAHVAGVELEAAAQIPQIQASFDVAYQYLFTRASETADGRGPLDYAAANRLTLRGHKRINIGPVVGFIDFYGLYVGERNDPALLTDALGKQTTRTTLPGYFVANARVGANVYKGLSASILATNLFNSQYQEMLGFPSPGISVFGELKYVR
jgi:hemoglobin/transferrin/lactoferrin receptor protein